MCIRHLIQKKIIAVIFLSLILNVVCDFSVFNFSDPLPKYSNVDLDNTYLESFLESIFHVNIKVGGRTDSNHQTASAFLFKLYTVVNQYDCNVILPVKEPEIKLIYITYQQELYSQLPKEIHSPPPQA